MPSRKRPSSKKGASPVMEGTPPELIVVAKAGAGLRATPAGVSSISGAKISSLNSLLKSSGARMTPVFGNEERVMLSMATATPETRATMPDLAAFYKVEADPDKLEKIAEKLLNENLVDGAYVQPPAFPPFFGQPRAPVAEEAPPASPNFISRQIYLDAAPAGIDARYAWALPGGKGQGVRIIDIEGAWRFSHEDLLQNQGGVIGGSQSPELQWRNHGTAVIGEIGGDENAFGTTGICPQANVRAISVFGSGQSSAKAISDAANALSPGDIILIELHRGGPRFNYQVRQDQLGYIAVEFWPDVFAAIVYATSVRGVIVVEAAGNGVENLDDALYDTHPAGFPSTWSNPFNLDNPQSGAIIVGAGAPPPGTHGRNHGPDRSRLGFSNHGARVDAQGWGKEVTTTGYSYLQGGGNEDLWYTDEFDGTSSASPIVVGAIGCMQGGLRAKNKPLLTPATARNILRNTGTPQQDAPGRPATQRIGKRPNLKQAFDRLGIGKGILKDIFGGKETKIEGKEKEFLKDGLGKETKVEGKEKEILKEVKDLKDIREFGGMIDAGANQTEARLSQLEGAIIELSHFISGSLRPDLQTSALSQEEDLAPLSQQLDKEASYAKSIKDDRDVA